jgi:hypothetical protein
MPYGLRRSHDAYPCLVIKTSKFVNESGVKCWKHACGGEEFPHTDEPSAVYSQRRDGRAADRRMALKSPFFGPSEMHGPCIAARVKEPYRAAGYRIAGMRPSSLVERTRNTGQRQILRRSAAAVEPWLNMIDVKFRFLPALVKPAVLTAIAGANADGAL